MIKVDGWVFQDRVGWWVGLVPGRIPEPPKRAPPPPPIVKYSPDPSVLQCKELSTGRRGSSLPDGELSAVQLNIFVQSEDQQVLSWIPLLYPPMAPFKGRFASSGSFRLIPRLIKRPPGLLGSCRVARLCYGSDTRNKSRTPTPVRW